MANGAVGFGSAGKLAVTGTGSVTETNALYVSGEGVATDPAGAGEVDLSGSGRLATQQTYVGYTGPATFNQSGGTDTTQYLVLDSPSGRTAAYHVSAGTVDATYTLDAFAPASDGPGMVDEGTAYDLGLFGTASTTHWQVGWGDGSTDSINGTPPSATHTYVLGGNTYTVSPVAYDSGNAPSPAGTVPVLVNDLPAHATAQASLPNTTVGQSVTLAVPFADPGTAETHTALVRWGDGTVSTGTVTESNGSGTVTAAHVYGLSGTLAGEVLITDNEGAVGTVNFTANVAYVTPSVSVAAAQASVTLGQSATLTLTDAGPEDPSALAWAVDWGDGSGPQAVTVPATMTDPANPWEGGTWTVTHTYTAAGTYTATATAGDSAGFHAAGSVTFTVTGTTAPRSPRPG